MSNSPKSAQKTKEEIIENIIKNKEATLSRHQNFDALKEGITEKFVLNSLNLKDRQQESVLKLIDIPSDNYAFSKGYFHACTAFGKTYLIMAMAEGYNHIQPNKKIIILEENASVLEQVKQDFATKTEQFNLSDIGTFYNKEKSIDTPVIISTYASMKKMIEQVGLENIGLVLCDEAHHILSKNRQEVAKTFNNACLYGFTATPDYDEDKNCAKVFENIIDQVTLSQGIDNKLLCSFKNSLMISRTTVDLSSAKNNSGDYDAKKLSEILKQSHLTGIREEIADFYLFGEDKTLGKLVGKSTIINTPNQEEAEELTKVFNSKAGYDIAKAYHSNTDDNVLEHFNQNKFPVLIQVNRVSEGYSNPNAEICFNYPTASKVRAAQCGGRVLRWNRENPEKIALIVDICFKKSNRLSPLEEIHQNGQVLFMDIAKETAIIHKDLRKRLNTQDTKNLNPKKEKEVFSNDELFDIVTDMEELYEMCFDQILFAEENTPKREKLSTDLAWSEFLIRIPLTQNGKNIPLKDRNKEQKRKDIWDKTLEEHPEFFIKTKANNLIVNVIPEQNLDAFKAYLKTFGIEIPNYREKLETDLGWQEFLSKTHLARNGKTIPTGSSDKEQIRKYIWDKTLEEYPEFFIKTKAKNLIVNVIPEENIDDFKAYLKTFDIEITDYRERLSTDLCWNDFSYKIPLAQNGKTIPTGAADKEQKRKAIWEKTFKEHPEFFIKTKATSVIPEQNLDTFIAYLKTLGIEITDYREKLSTDLSWNEFYKTPLSQNGKTIQLDYKNKKQIRKSIWEKAFKEHPEFFIKAKTGFHTKDIIPKENMDAFKAYLKTFGIEINDYREKLSTDISWHDFLYKTTLDQNGKTIPTKSSDKEQKRKYIWDNTFKEHPEFFVKAKTGNLTVDIIPEENLDNFKTYLKTFNVEITNCREKLSTDLLWHEFYQKIPLAQNGKTIPVLKNDKKQIRKSIWKKALEEHPEFFIKARAGSRTLDVIPEQNLDNFITYINSKGISLKISKEELLKKSFHKNSTPPFTPPTNEGM